ncbi:MAG: Deblocking aminopeptidase [Candidatus Bipolaricaulis sibiricus]|uniref:Deblocking aminopeptidase n=1 Tax=Bipolaricaulis sibiricus TaxID=2501609 RepID=A0A410FVV9_BIPS1|nr:MAG: Deblocking aminopeptidase [Candidatus Bipolaricaulis sibiricus]
MDKGKYTFLERFLSTISPSGFETDAAAVWRAEAAQFAQRTWADLHGNAFASLNEAGAPRVMLAGHMDEIGLMVSHITDSGYLYTRPIGGWDAQILPGQRVWVHTKKGRVLGVIGRKPIHLLADEDKKNVVKVEDLWIDIGAKSKADAGKRVEIGDPIVLAHSPDRLSDDLLVARGVDDRIGAFVALEALRHLKALKPKAAVFAVATVQEEIGLRGARTSAYGLDPTVGIAVDVCHTTDTPGTEGEKKKLGEIALGKGPVLARGPNINPKLFDHLVATAKKAKIPYQVEAAPAGTGTDANAMQLNRAGMATALVSIPNRYMHSPCEVVSLKDVENAAKLIAHAVAALTATTDLVPGEKGSSTARPRATVGRKRA